MEVSLFTKYIAPQSISALPERVEYASDILKVDMQKFFSPKDKKERALLFGAFSKYHHGKIRDAFITCEKGWKATEDMKFKSILYMIGIVRNLK